MRGDRKRELADLAAKKIERFLNDRRDFHIDSLPGRLQREFRNAFRSIVYEALLAEAHETMMEEKP